MATIAIIDDSAPMRRMIREILSRNGHDIVEAADGMAVQELIEKHAPHIVITDIFMPNKDGIEVIRDIRRVAPKTRIIAITGGDSVREDLYLHAASTLGADRSIKKPFRVDELREAVRDLLGERPTGD